MLHLIIDAYNLIRQIDDLERHEKTSLEAGRRVLVEKLKAYRRLKPHHITVVFDGVNALGESASTYKEGGIRVCFSAAPQKADDVIKDLARELKNQAIIVSSDRSVTDFAKSCGAATISAPAFYDKLSMAAFMDIKGGATPVKDGGPSHKRWTTYKKGPSKRLPKKVRLGKTKLEKL